MAVANFEAGYEEKIDDLERAIVEIDRRRAAFGRVGEELRVCNSQ